MKLLYRFSSHHRDLVYVLGIMPTDSNQGELIAESSNFNAVVDQVSVPPSSSSTSSSTTSAGTLGTGTSSVSTVTTSSESLPVGSSLASETSTINTNTDTSESSTTTVISINTNSHSSTAAVTTSSNPESPSSSQGGQSSPTGTSSGASHRSNLPAIIGGVVGGSGLFIIAGVLITIRIRNQKRRQNQTRVQPYSFVHPARQLSSNKNKAVTADDNNNQQDRATGKPKRNLRTRTSTRMVIWEKRSGPTPIAPSHPIQVRNEEDAAHVQQTELDLPPEYYSVYGT
ncbi:hypothetical protein BT96DRAFT_419590 [Gymnopus androsaceus JB14]|uniref:Mid2 domain-containing protein n=1 Tax=Gymnopus androsaceus JB14 TaxID=1447944 RepID=A0A6A4I6W6_9AGAR|nr:hypothetical protein BT96DRAFT_419590 [Gymnopus androsaceus JB14]